MEYTDDQIMVIVWGSRGRPLGACSLFKIVLSRVIERYSGLNREKRT